jgi:hypothetical protein
MLMGVVIVPEHELDRFFRTLRGQWVHDHSDASNHKTTLQQPNLDQLSIDLPFFEAESVEKGVNCCSSLGGWKAHVGIEEVRKVLSMECMLIHSILRIFLPSLIPSKWAGCRSKEIRVWSCWGIFFLCPSRSWGRNGFSGKLVTAHNGKSLWNSVDLTYKIVWKSTVLEN